MSQIKSKIKESLFQIQYRNNVQGNSHEVVQIIQPFFLIYCLLQKKLQENLPTEVNPMIQTLMIFFVVRQFIMNNEGQTDTLGSPSENMLGYSSSHDEQLTPRPFSFLKPLPYSTVAPATDLMSQARMQQSIEFPQLNSPVSHIQPLQAFETISQLGGGPQAEAEIMKLRTENQTILRNLNDLTKKYNQICAENVRAGRVAMLSDRQTPSIENIVNVGQLLEINALLRTENSNLIQSQHLLRMINVEQEKQSVDQQEIDNLKVLIKKLKKENKELLGRKEESHNVSIMDEDNVRELRQIRLKMQQMQRELLSTQQALIDQRRSNKHLREQLAKTKTFRLRSHNSSYSVFSRDDQVNNHEGQKVLAYYGKELGRLVCENDRLTAENNLLKQSLFEKGVCLEKLEEQKKFLNQQTDGLRKELQLIRQTYEHDKHIIAETHDKKIQILTEENQHYKISNMKAHEQISQLHQQIQKKEKYVSFYVKTAEETHKRLSKVLDLEEELKKSRQQNQRLQENRHIQNLKLTENGDHGKALAQIWRQKNNYYVKIHQQLNSFRALRDMSIFDMHH